MSLFLYNIFTKAYTVSIKLAALWNNKAKLWVTGRHDIFLNLQLWRNSFPVSNKVVWMHCASLGEFEQGRPVMEAIKKTYPGYRIIITFFSPSGYEVRKNYAGADAVFYLPQDGKQHAEKFINIVKPALVVWIKYEFWYHYLTTLKKKNIPVLLVSAIFRKDQPFFKWYGSIWKEMLGCFNKIFVQNKCSAVLLQQLLPNVNAVVGGDTRFDRVKAIAENEAELPIEIVNFCKDFKVIVAGSTWQEDEEEIVHFAKMNPQIKCIIAPHEIDEKRLIEIQKLFARSVLFSKFNAAQNDIQVIVIDNIGMLSQLYKMANVAYVGGGFNSSGIHNILEAAVYGIPVIFGPEYEKFKEASDLVEMGGAYSINDALELETLLTGLFENNNQMKNASAVCKKYVYENGGATASVMNYIYEKRLLTN